MYLLFQALKCIERTGIQWMSYDFLIEMKMDMHILTFWYMGFGIIVYLYLYITIPTPCVEFSCETLHLFFWTIFSLLNDHFMESYRIIYMYVIPKVIYTCHSIDINDYLTILLLLVHINGVVCEIMLLCEIITRVVPK